jgi:hypothetical protein
LLRNWSPLSTTNGLTFATHANGSLGPEGVVHVVEVTGRHCPGSSPHVNWNDPKRPSFVRSEIIAAAAA